MELTLTLLLIFFAIAMLSSWVDTLAGDHHVRADVDRPDSPILRLDQS
ncbi:hypothetical protein [Microbulbifer marinus]|nr:hypothetical protein [Microbulbifer marinus]